MIATKEGAIRTARWGSYAAFAGAFFISIAVLLKYAQPTALGIYSWIDRWALIDAGLFLLIGIGIWKMSRAAAVVGLVLYFQETAWKWDKMGSTGFGAVQVLWTILFIICYVQGVRGTFAYQALLNLEKRSASVGGTRAPR